MMIVMEEQMGYSYRRLEGTDSIRLLMVDSVGSSNKGRGPIRCWLKHFSLSNAPPYRALSYSWGNTETKKIFLNDRVVEVRKNLWEALAHIQFASFDFRTAGRDQIFAEENSRWVWIDALCIDQENIGEKNHQVKLMSKIYRGATEVLVWLGCEKDCRNGPGISAAMDAMALMTSGKEEEDASLIFDQNHEGLFALFHLPYWRRLWIVQEIGLASRITLLFDKVSTSWTALHKFRKLLSSEYFPNKFGLSPGSTFTSTEKAALLGCQAFRLDRHRMGTHRHLLYYLIESFQDCLCSDPRDKVYGLLALADDCRKGQLEADYFKSDFDVYSDVVSFYYTSRRMQGPSQHAPRTSQIIQQAFRTTTVESEIGPGAIRYAFSIGSAVLRPSMHVFGVLSGIVTDLGESIGRPEKYWPKPISPTKPSKKYDSMMISKALRDVQKLVPFRTRASFALQAKHATNDLIAQNMTRSSPTGDPLLEPQDRGTQFFLDNGRTGYGPYNTLEGDFICQFLGCDIAAVLRRNGQVFEIIGKALVSKSSGEHAGGEPWAKKYDYAVPDYGKKFMWEPEHAMYLYLDLVTLQLLTQ